MTKLQINQKVIYIIFALVGIGFLGVLYFSIYRVPQEGVIIPEVSGVIESVEGQTIAIKKADSSTSELMIDNETRIRAYNTAGTYEQGSIENLTIGLSVIAGDIAGDRAGYIDIYIPPGERGGVIESIIGDTVTINSETHGKFSVTIDDNLTYIRTINSADRFIPADRTHISIGKVIVVVQEIDGVASWIDVYPADNFVEEGGADEN